MGLALGIDTRAQCPTLDLGNAGEDPGDPAQGVAAGGMKDDPAQRNHQHAPRVHGAVADEAHQNHGRARRRLDVLLWKSLMLVSKHPASSATPTPEMATNATPTGAELVKMVTMFEGNSPTAGPERRFTSRMGSPVRGSRTVNWTGGSRAESPHTTKRGRG